jgi:hypothetical protein
MYNNDIKEKFLQRVFEKFTSDDKKTLPLGWEARFDYRLRKIYYINKKRGNLAQYEFPDSLSVDFFTNFNFYQVIDLLPWRFSIQNHQIIS